MKKSYTQVAENSCSHHIVEEKSYFHHIVCEKLIAFAIEKLENNLINLQSTEPWQVCSPDELGKLVLGASEAIFDTWGRRRGVNG